MENDLVISTELGIVDALTWVEGGVTLVCPSLRLEIAVPWAEGPEVLDFHQRSREALGDLLRFVDTGSGKLRPVTAKTEEQIRAACEQPVPYPKKQYFWIQRSVAQGVTPAELYVDFVMRTDQSPTQQMFERWRKPDAYPNLRYSTLAVAFPLDHPLAQPERFLAWVSELDVVRHRRFLCATAGYCLLRAINAPTFESGQRAGNHAGAMLLRHPGLDVARWVHAALAVHDVDYVERMRQPVAKPLIRRANWLNFLSVEQVALLGGMDALQSRFDGMPTIRLAEFAHGLLIRAGNAPQLGDAAAGLFPKEYCEVAKALAPLRVPKIKFSALGQAFDRDGEALWFRVLERQ